MRCIFCARHSYFISFSALQLSFALILFLAVLALVPSPASAELLLAPTFEEADMTPWVLAGTPTAVAQITARTSGFTSTATKGLGIIGSFTTLGTNNTDATAKQTVTKPTLLGSIYQDPGYSTYQVGWVYKYQSWARRNTTSTDTRSKMHYQLGYDNAGTFVEGPGQHSFPQNGTGGVSDRFLYDYDSNAITSNAGGGSTTVISPSIPFTIGRLGQTIQVRLRNPANPAFPDNEIDNIHLAAWQHTVPAMPVWASELDGNILGGTNTSSDTWQFHHNIGDQMFTGSSTSEWFSSRVVAHPFMGSGTYGPDNWSGWLYPTGTNEGTWVDLDTNEEIMMPHTLNAVSATYMIPATDIYNIGLKIHDLLSNAGDGVQVWIDVERPSDATFYDWGLVNEFMGSSGPLSTFQAYLPNLSLQAGDLVHLVIGMNGNNVGDETVIDEFWVATVDAPAVEAIAEPSTVSLLGMGGLLGLLALRKRLRLQGRQNSS